MDIHELFRIAGVEPSRLEGSGDVGRLAMDSRKVKPGMMFVCMPSANSDSNAFIPQAVANGATAVLTFSEEGFEAARSLGVSAALLPADLYNDSLWKLCKIAFDNPSATMKVIGVTGTNGKTTTCWLIRDMLQALGVKAGYIGTLGFQIPGVERELANTTPFAIELNELLAEARDAGVEAIAMEVSSHALAEKRADGVEFDVGVFTNLTQDHLDFHGSMEAYEAAKLRLFTELPQQAKKNMFAAINLDDSFGRQIADLIKIPWGGYGLLESEAFPYTRAIPVTTEIDHLLIGFTDSNMPSNRHVRVSLGGNYNVENCLSAISGVLALGFAYDAVYSAAVRVRPVPGRFEPVSNNAGLGIIIDYAHTPDAIEKVIATARPLTSGRIITVFGCGGDRDRGKRPLMAKAASEGSDLTVVTSDNPRTEDPQAILGEVMAGIAPGREAIAILDRPEAVAYAILQAKEGDTVIIAGKGHENYQIIGRIKYPMDDRELARAGLAARTEQL